MTGRFNWRTLLVALVCLAAALAPGSADGQTPRPVQYRVSTFATASTGERVPFWIQANEYGVVDRNAQNLGTRLSLRRPYPGDGVFDLGFGAEVLGRLSEKSTGHVHQLYGQVRYRGFELTAGWKRRMTGLVDSTLTMGSMVTSGNAAPLPRVELSTAGFVGVPGLGELLAVQGHFAHGWFLDDRYVRNPYLHSKSLYLRVFPTDVRVQLYGGIVHNAFWAGTHPAFGDLADGLGDYWDVLFTQPSNAPDAEPGSGHTLGNSLGMYDFSVALDLGEVTARPYRQFYVETGAGAQFRNVWDGLWGVSLQLKDRPRLVQRLLWEHLYTKRQSAQQEMRGTPSYGEYGTDSYYNHYAYQSGWTHHGRTIGTPLLFSNGVDRGVQNNIVIAHHVGLAGTVWGNRYRLFGTWSRNYGEEHDLHEPPLTQWSFLLEMTRTIRSVPGLRVRGGVALDTGEVYEKRLGLELGVSWQGAGSL